MSFLMYCQKQPVLPKSFTPNVFPSFFYYTLSSHNILQNWLLWVLELIKATIHTQTGCHICSMCVHLSVTIMLGAGFLHMHLVDILRIRSWEGHRKAFSTCSSHPVWLGPSLAKLLSCTWSKSSSILRYSRKCFSCFTLFFQPHAEPPVYSLRNAEVKDALWRALCKESHSQLLWCLDNKAQ